jgi:hypothetical protein
VLVQPGFLRPQLPASAPCLFTAACGKGTHCDADRAVSFGVISAVQPGFLRPQLPASAPQQPEPWQNIKQDFYDKIMRGECYFVTLLHLLLHLL